MSAIQQYWDTRAASHQRSAAATTNDVHLRVLEARTLVRAIKGLSLPRHARAIDIGCGDGRTTIAVARELPDVLFDGVDYSASMVANAHALLEENRSLADRLRFSTADVLTPGALDNGLEFDIAFTCRCLINLPEEEHQRQALTNIARCIKPGGWFFAIENLTEGHDEMNRARRSLGLDEIPVRWHNRFFTEASITDMTRNLFEIIAIENFASAYYYATRVIYAKMCSMRGSEPDYDHDIHRLAVDLPPIGGFSPVKLLRMRRL